MYTGEHAMTTTAHTAQGLVPICHCGWAPGVALAKQDEAVLAEVQHNLGFLMDACPLCAGDLESHRTRWKVRESGSRHFEDRWCVQCGWQASRWPE